MSLLLQCYPCTLPGYLLGTDCSMKTCFLLILGMIVYFLIYLKVHLLNLTSPNFLGKFKTATFIVVYNIRKF